MMKENANNGQRCEIVERYCPSCNRNVVMMRTHGINTTLKCMNYADCRVKKDGPCAHTEQD